jgi:hypothetical protein
LQENELGPFPRRVNYIHATLASEPLPTSVPLVGVALVLRPPPPASPGIRP